MSVCISQSETPLALRLIALTQSGLPLVEDPGRGWPSSWAWASSRPLTCSSACRPKARSGALPRCPTTTAWAIAITA